MKYITTLFLAILLFTVSSCDKENNKSQIVEQTEIVEITTCELTEESGHGAKSICTTDICSQYFNIWKDLIQEKNNLNQEFHDAHIAIHRTSLNSWAKGISYRVCYDFKIDWAVAYNCDHFIIKIDINNSHYPALDLPRDVYLNKDQIALVAENRAFSSEITKMTNSNELTSQSLENAMNELINFSEVNLLCLRKISLDSDSGNLVLKASAEYVDQENSCIFGTFDLITGIKEAIDGLCYI